VKKWNYIQKSVMTKVTGLFDFTTLKLCNRRKPWAQKNSIQQAGESKKICRVGGESVGVEGMITNFAEDRQHGTNTNRSQIVFAVTAHSVENETRNAELNGN